MSRSHPLLECPEHGLLSWLRSFVPASYTVSRRERLYGCVGAFLGLLCTEWISRHALGDANPWFIAPMGASAVLLFAVPASPLAQPWSILGGNLISALVGVACGKLIGTPALAAALAVGLSIGLMFQARCLHPPGGAVALTSVLGGPAVTDLGYGFAFWPVAVDSMSLLLIALVFNIALGRRYPHHPHEHPAAKPVAASQAAKWPRVTLDDLNAVLEERGELVDISSDDLEEILVAAERRAALRLNHTAR